MATPRRKGPAQHWIVQYLPIETLKQARNLADRFQAGDGFRLYVLDRMGLVIPAVLVILVISVSCAVGIVVFLANAHPLLALPAILLVPVVLFGSLFVQLYVFFAWLEGRALARALGRRRKLAPGALATWFLKKFGLDMGPFPPVPWILSAVVLFAPLTMLAFFSLGIALLVIVLAIMMPILYVRFER